MNSIRFKNRSWFVCGAFRGSLLVVWAIEKELQRFSLDVNRDITKVLNPTKISLRVDICLDFQFFG